MGPKSYAFSQPVAATPHPSVIPSPPAQHCVLFCSCPQHVSLAKPRSETYFGSAVDKKVQDILANLIVVFIQELVHLRGGRKSSSCAQIPVPLSYDIYLSLYLQHRKHTNQAHIQNMWTLELCSPSGIEQDGNIIIEILQNFGSVGTNRGDGMGWDTAVQSTPQSSLQCYPHPTPSISSPGR